MKRMLLLLMLVILLAGCRAETMETVEDVWEEAPVAEARQIRVSLPGEEALPVMESSADRLYLGEHYQIEVQTLPGGDLNRTVQTMSGLETEDVTLMQTEQAGLTRYDFVWAAAGEEGDQLGRGAILDDGNYHYALSVLRSADDTATRQIHWDQVFSSFSAEEY